MSQVTRLSYKLLSTILLIGGGYGVYSPSGLAQYTSLTLHTSTEEMLIRIISIISIVLSACLCGATASTTSSKSSGAGIVLGACIAAYIFGIFNTMNQYTLIAYSTLAIIGLFGLLCPSGVITSYKSTPLSRKVK